MVLLLHTERIGASFSVTDRSYDHIINASEFIITIGFYINVVYLKFSKNSASLIIQHLLHYNKIISLKKFGTYNTLV